MQSLSVKLAYHQHRQNIQSLLNRYRGLREEDLNDLNPAYSCVLCGCYTCKHHNQPKKGCLSQRPIAENEWAEFYIFNNG